MKRVPDLLRLLLLSALALRGWASDPFSSDRWAYLDNGQVRLGINMSAGGCIGYMSLSGCISNVLNHHDRGRFVQQSYYGMEDGTFWAKQKWRWNPVQGGDYRHNPARILEEKTTRTTGYTRSMARHWSGCVDLPEVTFEQWITLTGKVAHVKFRMTYTGTNDHPTTGHEIPAVFLNPEYKNLFVYNGAEPWSNRPPHKSVPGWPNESRKITEHWAAYLDDSGLGLAAYVPASSNLTCYIFGNGNASQGACSYFAPLINFPVKRGTRFEYDLWLLLGTLDEMRDTIYQIERQRTAPGARNRATR